MRRISYCLSCPKKREVYLMNMGRWLAATGPLTKSEIELLTTCCADMLARGGLEIIQAGPEKIGIIASSVTDVDTLKRMVNEKDGQLHALHGRLNFK